MTRSRFGDGDLRRLREMPARVARLMADFEKRRAQIERAKDAPAKAGRSAAKTGKGAAESGIEADRAALRQSVQGQLDRLRSESKLRARRLERTLDQAISRDADHEGQSEVLRELREHRAWARLRGILDRSGPGTADLPAQVRQLTTELLVAGDDDGLAALRTELPAYLRGRGAESQLAEILDGLETAVAAVRPDTATALELKREFEALLPRVVAEIEAAEAAIWADGSEAPSGPAITPQVAAPPATNPPESAATNLPEFAAPPATKVPAAPLDGPQNVATAAAEAAPADPNWDAPVAGAAVPPPAAPRTGRAAARARSPRRGPRLPPLPAALIGLAGLGAIVVALLLLGSHEAANLSPAAQPVRVAEILLLAGLIGLAVGLRLMLPDWPPSLVPAVTRTRTFGLTKLLGIAAGAILGFLAIQFWIGQWQGIFPWLFLLGWALAGAIFVARDDVLRTIRPRLDRRSAFPLVFVGLVSIVFLWLCLRDTKAWYFSAIGDEYAFLDMAQAVLNGSTLPNTQNIFSQRGVFQDQPWLGTVYQAAVMAVFGRERTGWLLSSALIAAAAFPPFFYLVRSLFSLRHAVLATLILLPSHFLLGISHIGYNNIHAIFPTVASLALSVLALRLGSQAASFAAGSMASLGFYTLYSARIALLVIFAAWLLLGRQIGRSRWVAFLMGAGIVLMPIVTTDKHLVITNMLARSAAKEFNGLGGLLGHLAQNTLTAISAFAYNNHTSHFVSGSLLDPVTVALAGTGLVLTLLHFWRFQVYLLWLWFLLALLATGVFSPYDYPPLTRLYFLVPIFAVFAALAAHDLIEAPLKLMPFLRRRSALPAVAMAALFAVVLVMNLRRFWAETPQRMQMTPTAVIVRVLTETNPACNAPETVVVAPEGHVTLIEKVFRSYGRDLAPPKVVSFKDWTPQRVDAGTRCAILLPNDADPLGRPVPDQLRGAFGRDPDVATDYRASVRIFVYRRDGAAT